MSSGDTTNDATIALTFTSDESTTDFAESDITETGCTLSAFGGSGDTYTATCTSSSDGTPSILVAADTYTDAAGNDNTVSNTYTWSYDTTSPGMTISSGTVTSGDSTATAAIALTFTSDESTTDFAESDITETGCTLSAFGGSGDTYTATCTSSSDGTPSILVAADTYTDAAGNDNTVSNTYTWSYDGDLARNDNQLGHGH